MIVRRALLEWCLAGIAPFSASLGCSNSWKIISLFSLEISANLSKGGEQAKENPKHCTFALDRTQIDKVT